MFREGVGAFRQALELAPNDVNLLVDVGNALTYASEYGEGEAAYRRALQLRPDNALIHYNLGTMLALEKRNAEARAQFEEALRLQRDFPEAQQQLDALPTR
jgi:Flp pilus assembly protein TadD